MGSDYKEERLALYRSVNAKNKRRGKEMERRVMKELRGTRVPMSGAGAIKGDGMIMHPDLGYILVECKMSAAVNSKGSGRINVTFAWFDKMDIEAKTMNARFPILVIHHLDSKQDYVFIREEVLDKYFPQYAGNRMPCKAARTNSWTAIRSHLEVALACYTDSIRLETSRGVYIMLTLQHFKELLLHE